MLTVLPTIDAEGVHGRNPFDDMMLGKQASGELWGVPMLADIFQKFGVSATFFLDVYEASYYGESVFKTLVSELKSKSQDIQLHTHPAWFDDRRDFPELREMKKTRSMFPADQYWMRLNSFEEQVAILQKGITLLEAWGAGRPIAHRAGAYALGKETPRALAAVGIPVDSSMYHGHKNCEITWSQNQLVEREGILELPVTGFWRNVYWKLGPLKHHRERKFIKTDIDWCSLDELIQYAEFAIKHNVATMNLFMHSYSLIKFDERFETFAPEPEDKEKLEAFLRYCKGNKKIRVMSIADYWKTFQTERNLGAEGALEVGFPIPFIGRLLEKMTF